MWNSPCQLCGWQDSGFVMCYRGSVTTVFILCERRSTVEGWGGLTVWALRYSVVGTSIMWSGGSETVSSGLYWLCFVGFLQLHRGYFTSWLHIHHLFVYQSQSVLPFDVIWVFFFLFSFVFVIVLFPILFCGEMFSALFLYFALSLHFPLFLFLCVSSCRHAKSQTKTKKI